MNVNEIFNYMGKQVRVLGDAENPLFCLKDVCDILDVDINNTVRRLEKGVCSKHPLQTKGGVQYTNFVNEDGLYDVILDSRKPIAKKFRKWITSEVLPSIRNTGGYLDINRSEVRAMTKESRTTLTEVFFNLSSICDWITSEQSNQYMRILSELANKLSGIGNGGRDKANTEQLMKLSLIENSFTKTLSKKMRKFRYERKRFSFKELIYKCEIKAEKALINAGFKTTDVYITTNW